MKIIFVIFQWQKWKTTEPLQFSAFRGVSQTWRSTWPPVTTGIPIVALELERLKLGGFFFPSKNPLANPGVFIVIIANPRTKWPSEIGVLMIWCYKPGVGNINGLFNYLKTSGWRHLYHLVGTDAEICSTKKTPWVIFVELEMMLAPKDSKIESSSLAGSNSITTKCTGTEDPPSSPVNPLHQDASRCRVTH